MTSPRSHSQKAVSAGFTSPCLVRPLALGTRPPSVFSPRSPSQRVAEPGTPRSEPRVKFPAGLDWGGQTLPPSLPCGQLGGPPRPDRSVRPASGRMRGAQPLRVPGALEEGRRAPAQCSPGSASYAGRWARLNPLYRREDKGAGGGAHPPEVTRPENARLPPRSRRLQNFPAPAPREPERLSGAERAHRLGGPGAHPPGRDARPALLSPVSAVPRPGGSLPTPRAPRLSGRGTYSASPRSSSPQPAKWPAGTHLQEGETEAQRGPAAGPRSHSAAARSRPGGSGLGAPRQPADRPPVPARVPADTHSRSCPRAPAPPRTRSGQRPWCPRRGPRGARPSQAPGWRRLRRGGSGLGSSAGRDAGDGSEPRVPRGARARPLIAAEGGAPRS